MRVKFVLPESMKNAQAIQCAKCKKPIAISVGHNQDLDAVEKHIKFDCMAYYKKEADAEIERIEREYRARLEE